MQPCPRTLFFIALAALCGCRATDPAMRATIMSERTDALGRDASGLTRADLDERRVLVPASAASRIATELDRIDFAFGALQDVDLDVDAARTLGFTPSHGSALRSASGRPAPHVRFSTTALRRDWETLCEDPMWSQLFPPTPGSGCDPLHRLRQIQPFLDDLDIRPRFGEATFSWERPQTLIPG